MSEEQEPIKGDHWLKWATEIQALAQIGLTYTKCGFDRQRYEQLMQIAAQMFATQSDHRFEKIMDLFHTQSGYTTPRVDVRGAIFEGDKILLVKERSDQKWTMPGGFADVNMSPSRNVEKEILEESGYVAKVTKLVGFYDNQKHNFPVQWPHIYKCFFLCDRIGGHAQTSIETSDVDFFRVDNLPELSTPRATAQQIEVCYRHFLDPSLPSDYD